MWYGTQSYNAFGIDRVVLESNSLPQRDGIFLTVKLDDPKFLITNRSGAKPSQRLKHDEQDGDSGGAAAVDPGIQATPEHIEARQEVPALSPE